MPKGLSDLRKDDGSNATRAAIETPIHLINDTLVEGGSVGCKRVDDIGSYRILPTKRAEQDRAILQLQNLVDDETTDEEDTQTEDEKQEDLFAQGESRSASMSSAG